MPTVDIDAADHTLFAASAAEAGLTVEQWLTQAGRAAVTEAGRSRLIGTDTPGDLGELWASTRQDLGALLNSRQQRSYLQTARLSAIVEGVALIVVPDAFTRDVFESRLRPAVVEALGERLGTEVQIALKVEPVRPGNHPPAGPPVDDPVPDDEVGRVAALLARPEVARQVAETLAAAMP